MQISNNPDEFLSLQSNKTWQIIKQRFVRNADKKVLLQVMRWIHDE